MTLYEKTLHSETLFTGHIIKVRLDTVQLPNGKNATREVVNHPGGVGILALDEKNNVLTVKQYRYVYGQRFPPASWSPARTPMPPPCGSCRRRPAPQRTSWSPWGRSTPPRAFAARSSVSTWPAT